MSTNEISIYKPKRDLQLTKITFISDKYRVLLLTNHAEKDSALWNHQQWSVDSQKILKNLATAPDSAGGAHSAPLDLSLIHI